MNGTRRNEKYISAKTTSKPQFSSIQFKTFSFLLLSSVSLKALKQKCELFFQLFFSQVPLIDWNFSATAD
jgi:hypothetical protein